MRTREPSRRVLPSRRYSAFKASPISRALQAAFEKHRRPAADDTHLPAAQRSELRNQLFGQTVAEVLLAAVVAEIAERQHDQPQTRRRRSGGRRIAPARDAADEPISAPRHRLDERRLVRIVTKRRAQTFDRRVETVFEIDERAFRPQTLTQLVARDHVAGPLQQETQNLERLLLQPHAYRAAGLDATQLARAHVELEGSEAQDG
jgi:hypothetical protein